jgi:glutamyl/glutaminyl-tRNA synthetase
VGLARPRDRVLLRIEDHDRQRSRPEFEDAIVEDLDWLGFVPDGPPVRQRERGDIYSQALETLKHQQLVYGCSCSRGDVARALQARDRDPERVALRTSDDFRYPGTCRDRGFVDAPGIGLRVRFEPSVERFVDLRHGPQEQRPSEQCGDLLIRDSRRQLDLSVRVTVDDYVQGVTHVIRGDDLLASTGRQLQVARLLGSAGAAALSTSRADNEIRYAEAVEVGRRHRCARPARPRLDAAQVIARARELTETTERR